MSEKMMPSEELAPKDVKNDHLDNLDQQESPDWKEAIRQWLLSARKSLSSLSQTGILPSGSRSNHEPYFKLKTQSWSIEKVSFGQEESEHGYIKYLTQSIKVESESGKVTIFTITSETDSNSKIGLSVIQDGKEINGVWFSYDHIDPIKNMPLLKKVEKYIAAWEKAVKQTIENNIKKSIETSYQQDQQDADALLEGIDAA